MTSSWFRLDAVPDVALPLACFAASSLIKLVVASRRWSVPVKAECVGRVTGLAVFPVKSLGGVQVDEAVCTHTGLRMVNSDLYDRRYLLTVGDEYRFVTARQSPRMLLVETSVDSVGRLCFDAPGMQRLTLPVADEIVTGQDCKPTKVWGKAISGWDCGSEAADWFTRFLAKPDSSGPHEQYHLSYNPGTGLRSIDHKQHLYVNGLKPVDQLAFHDDGPFLLTTESSLRNLTGRLADVGADPPVTMQYFRPSITVNGNSSPFDEDNWNELYIGDAKFTRFMPCARCMLTTIDPTKGEIRTDGEPLKTLRSYRKIQHNNESPCFGIYLVCDRPATIRVNDNVYALRRRSDWPA